MNNCNTTIDALQSSRKVTVPEMLTESLRVETRFDYHWCSAIKALSRLAFGVGIALLVLQAFLAFNSIEVSFQSTSLLFSLSLVSVGLYTSEVYHERKRKQQRLVTKLLNHAVAVGPVLMLMHQEQAGEVLSAAKQVLKVHLPMLREKDYDAFNVSQRSSICFLLKSKDQELVLAAAEALRFVGDDRAICPLQALMTASNVSDDIRCAVEVSIHAISLRSKANQQARILLRAGSSPAAAQSSLLRSSKQDQEILSEQLVRAVK